MASHFPLHVTFQGFQILQVSTLAIFFDFVAPDCKSVLIVVELVNDVYTSRTAR